MGNYPPVLVEIVRSYAVSDESHLLLYWPFEYKEYSNTGDDICIGGHVALLPQCTVFSKHMMDLAAAYNHISVVQWLQTHSPAGCTRWAMDWAAENGHLEMMKLLQRVSIMGCTTHAMNMAATNGHTEAFKWLYALRASYTEDALYGAVRNGHLSIVMCLCVNTRYLAEAIEISIDTNRDDIYDYLCRVRTERLNTGSISSTPVYANT